MPFEALAEQALAMRRFSYIPYSRFSVGAALLGEDGKIYTGCNVENAAYGPSNCAERTAVFKAVSEGCRRFQAIAVAGGPADADPDKGLPECPPCGVCRQVLREFCADDFPVILVRSAQDWRVMTLGELLPASFGPEHVKTDPE